MRHSDDETVAMTPRNSEYVYIPFGDVEGKVEGVLGGVAVDVCIARGGLPLGHNGHVPQRSHLFLGSCTALGSQHTNVCVPRSISIHQRVRCQRVV
jgi:hypothetical protein